MPTYHFVKTQLEGGIARITLAKEPLNVMTTDMLEELCEALAWAAESPGHLVLIDAQGRAFSAGVSVGDHAPESVEKSHGLFRRALTCVHECEKPTVAAVDGYALGGGCELALACDLILASPRATFGQPEIGVGALAGMACWALQRRVPHAVAAEMLITGERISAQRAFEVGLVNAVLEQEDFAQAVNEYLQRITRHSPYLLTKVKKCLRATNGLDWEEGLDAATRIYTEEVLPSHDAQEGIAAFGEKRAPVWRGC